MTTTKRKVSVSLDEDLVSELEAGGQALSSQVNEGVLTAARAGSADMVDAHVVAAAVEAGGGVIVTDSTDIERLAASYPNVHIAAI